MKDSFVLYTKYRKQIKGLSMEQRGILFTAILMYEANEEVPEMDGCTQMAFDFICTDLDENRKKYEEKCSRNTENGQKGGRPKKSVLEKANETEKSERFLEKRTQAKKADNDSDNDMNLKKLSYGEYKKVRMTETEYGKLCAEFGEQKTRDAISFLDSYIAEKGYKSKSHYLALRRWVFDAVEEKQPKARSGTKFQNFPAREDPEHKDMVAKIIAMNTGG